MKIKYTKVDPSQDVILDPVYMTREQWECATYIPLDQRSRIIIVYFIEDEVEDER